MLAIIKMLFNARKKINKIYNTYLARGHFDAEKKKKKS